MFVGQGWNLCISLESMHSRRFTKGSNESYYASFFFSNRQTILENGAANDYN